MKKLILATVLAACVSAQGATSYTEFYCNSTGTNINAGSTTNATTDFGFSNGGWSDSTGVFTATGADIGISVGDWASVFVDGATTAVFIGRITAVDDTLDTITVSLTIKSGIPPTTAATGRSIRVGGAWYGPWYSGATVDNLPFNFANALLTNTSQHTVRVNLKGDHTYGMTNVSHASNGPIVFQGWTNTVGDGGRALLAGSAVGGGHTMFTLTAANCSFSDLEFATNGTTGNFDLVSVATGGECEFYRCVFSQARGSGLASSAIIIVTECEAFACNANNSSANAGFEISGSAGLLRRCIAHSNTGNSTPGFAIGGGAMMLYCIGATNGRDGALVSSVTQPSFIGCDFYNNASNGINFTASSAMSANVESCSFIGNGAFGINSSGSLLRNGRILNCGFGSGTAANAGGTILTGTGFDEIGTVTYAANATPWSDPATGDFRISLAASKNTGRGLFLQTASGLSGTVSYPDIGAAQATNDVSGGIRVVPIGRR